MSSQPRSPCPLAFALDLIGDRWTLLVLRDMIFMGKRRFSEFRDSHEGIATNILSDRLQRLVEAGLIESEQDSEDGRRVLYALTNVGLDLVPVLVELLRWGGRHDPNTGASADLLDRLENDKEAMIAEIFARHRG